jgi:hypothetical protein
MKGTSGYGIQEHGQAIDIATVFRVFTAISLLLSS